MNNSGSGAASGSTFNGSAAVILSYNTLGAAPLASPALTGTPTSPTQAISTNNTDIATTAAVTAALAGYSTLTRTITTITASATPAITSCSNCLQTITLSANATPTVSSIAAGQTETFQICQPATGGPYTWTWPAAIHGGMTIGTTASDCSMQEFVSYTGTTLVPNGSPGVINVAP